MLTAYIAMGSNLAGAFGSPEATLIAAAKQLSSLGRELCRSSLYSTEPVGYVEQPHFLNAVVSIQTALSARALLTGLLDLEHAFGRDRSHGIANGPRTLDLDILLLGDLCIYESGLEIPHPRLAERAFVLVPLQEIAPELIDPRHRKSITELLHRLVQSEKEVIDGVVQFQSDLWQAGGAFSR
ncbi:MAG TPA: 2-amino-4-hydroxy-6-hydroxymethyldihydropteridine diphosphokinase [Terracidiphilus sp.]|jgi:2-amino-4-hydroxy-6-hydroxymethyldihydropteridine diphosphokinase|nr:2-amino-4-hydroxy-6-hydroxymethyldihydropteridine diphosphokinase [Terracidiphilus sp.]